MKSEDSPQYFSAQHSDRISYSQSGRFEAHALSHIQVWARRNARGCMFLPHPLAHNFLRKPKKITKNTLTLWLKERDKSLWINTFSICCAYLLQHSFNKIGIIPGKFCVSCLLLENKTFQKQKPMRIFYYQCSN